jgi:hypothetical protein
VVHPLTVTLRSEVPVYDMGSFNFVPVEKTGEYVLVFSNPDDEGYRFINLTYTTRWPDYTWMTFTLGGGDSRTVQVHVNSGQQLGGDFWVMGETGTDVDFGVVGYTCSEGVPFSFLLTNRGNADGYAEVAFVVDGRAAWTNKYFVPAGGSVPVSGNVTIENCAAHNFDIVIERQYKP